MTPFDHRNHIGPECATFLDSRHRLLIGGAWVEAADGATQPVTDPATGVTIATVAMGGAEDVDRAVRAARRAFVGEWGRSNPFTRATALRRLGRLIRDHAETLAQIEVLDNGMPIALSRTIVAMSADLVTYYAGAAEQIEGTTTTPPPQVLGDGGEALTYTLREAVGVVGQIVPWNVPLSMACLKLAPALAAGCTCILKRAEETPLSALLLGQLIAEAGIPDGVVNIVNGTGEAAGAALAAHPGVDKISFTGSTEIGRRIVRTAADTLKKVSLELGGKSPVIVFDDADLARAIPGVAMATFFLQGQNCMAGTRIFVHERIHDALVSGMTRFAQAMVIGHGLDPATQIGPLISARQAERVRGFVRDGQAEGARLVTGGEGTGNFVSPAIFTDATAQMRIVREEIFGPVMAIERFADDDLDALAERANDSPYGLSGSVWTQNLSRAHRMAARIRSGHVSINCHGAVAPNIPFGGYKQSGWGREFGRDGLALYLETKAITARL